MKKRKNQSDESLGFSPSNGLTQTQPKRRSLQDSFKVEAIDQDVSPSLQNFWNSRNAKTVVINAATPRHATFTRQSTPYNRAKERYTRKGTKLNMKFENSDSDSDCNVPLLVDVKDSEVEYITFNLPPLKKMAVEGVLTPTRSEVSDVSGIDTNGILPSVSGSDLFVEEALHGVKPSVSFNFDKYIDSESDSESLDREVTIDDLIITTEDTASSDVTQQSEIVPLFINFEPQTGRKLTIAKSNGHEEESVESYNGNVSEDENKRSEMNSSEIEINEQENVESDFMNEIPKVKYIGKNDKLLIIMDKHAVVYLHGFVSLRVICGSVEILGYLLDANSESVNLYSPRGSAFLSITTVESVKETGFVNTEEILQSYGLESYEIKDILDGLTSDTTILACSKLKSQAINFIEHYISQQIFPKEIEGKLRCNFREFPQDWNVNSVPAKWDKISEGIIPGSKVFLCGGKGVGKSTFLRYLINRLLMTHKEVRVLDLDPGQPEFTAPGCVSLVTVRNPVFGPNYTHITQPDRCMFVPNVNISYDPITYMSSVQELLDYPPSDVPTLVNYMGYSRGLGASIAAAVIAEVKPTVVVEIKSRHYRKNFECALTAEYVRKTVSNLQLLPVTNTNCDYVYVPMDSMADESRGWDLEPRQVREMCLLAYLSEMLPPFVVSITSPKLAVYRINLSELKLISNGREVPPSVVIANLVALCSCESNRNGQDVYRCYGWGVVRGVDTLTNDLYLSTPESEVVLSTVDVLVYGSVNLPPSVYMTEGDVEGLVPYVSDGVLSSFSSIPKRSYLPKEVTMGQT